MPNLRKKARNRYFVVPPKPVELRKPEKVETPPPEKPRTPSKPITMETRPPEKPRTPPKIIIGDTTSSGPFVREQVIKLNPKAGERGTGAGSKPGAGATIGGRTGQKPRSPGFGVGGGGRRKKKNIGGR